MNTEAVKTFYDLLGHKKQTEIRAIELSKDFKTSKVILFLLKKNLLIKSKNLMASIIYMLGLMKGQTKAQKQKMLFL